VLLAGNKSLRVLKRLAMDEGRMIDDARPTLQ
jgi:hypothetical protein